jgi:hypothetical protein
MDAGNHRCVNHNNGNLGSGNEISAIEISKITFARILPGILARIKSAVDVGRRTGAAYRSERT